MSVCGIVCEYNPFHEGHEYQIVESLAQTGAKEVVCLMSGNFVQRGEPAVFDKYVRAKAALKAGAAAVVELPVPFAVSPAEKFAHSSVYLLNALGCVDFVCFGSESGNLENICEAARFFANESDVFKENLRKQLSEGQSFAKARSLAAENNFPIFTPNDILGVEYVKALIRQKSKMRPVAVKRNKNFQSASEIRRGLCKKNIVCLDDFSEILRFEALRRGREGLTQIAEVREGLENRLYAACFERKNVSDVVGAVKSKRYTESSIRRMCVNIILGIEQEEFNTPRYIRVLGIRQDKIEVLKKIGKNACLPLVTKAADLRKLDEKAKKLMNKDIFASELYEIVRGVPKHEFSSKLITN